LSLFANVTPKGDKFGGELANAPFWWWPATALSLAEAAIDRGTKALDALVRGVESAEAKDTPPGEVE